MIFYEMKISIHTRMKKDVVNLCLFRHVFDKKVDDYLLNMMNNKNIITLINKLTC